MVVAKIIMQKNWLSKIDWDSTLNSEFLVEWTDFITQIPQLKNLKMLRNLFSNSGIIMKIQLHGFCDASLRAYGACVYIRTVYVDGHVTSKLVSSKSRVVPLKTLSIPRLELCAALLLSKLVSKTLAILQDKLVIDSVNLYSDSQITLFWIKAHPSKWTIFVSNRVSEIQQLTSSFNWCYIKSIDNPADLVSRGMTPSELMKSDLWFNGPQFLRSADYDFQNFKPQEPLLENVPEQRVSKTILHSSKEDKMVFLRGLLLR